MGTHDEAQRQEEPCVTYSSLVPSPVSQELSCLPARLPGPLLSVTLYAAAHKLLFDTLPAVTICRGCVNLHFLKHHQPPGWPLFPDQPPKPQ